jgi:hypothetical protein
MCDHRNPEGALCSKVGRNRKMMMMIITLKVKSSKAVPLHAMEAFGGRVDIAPTHS